MKRLLSILVGFGLANPVAVQGKEPIGDWNTDVLRLFLLEERDEALQKLLKEARYPKDPAYTVNDVGRIKEVVLCPQQGARPLVTIFVESKNDPEDVSPRSGGFVVIRNDGLILPFYHGACYLDGHFRDLNGDGAMDYIDSWEIDHGEGMVTGLHLVPIREGFAPALVVYWLEGAFEWRLHQPDMHRIPTIQIGSEKQGRFETIAEYRWSRDKKQWLGPGGSPEAYFMRVDGDPRLVARKLVRPQAGPRQVELLDWDAHKGPVVLDLASGELLMVPKEVESQNDVTSHFNQLGKGDIAWDGVIVTLRGARISEWLDDGWTLRNPEREHDGAGEYRLTVPSGLRITTAEGGHYIVDVKEKIENEKGVRIEYQPSFR